MVEHDVYRGQGSHGQKKVLVTGDAAFASIRWSGIQAARESTISARAT